MKSNIAPVAPRMRTKLKYTTDYTWATTMAFDQQYRLNSLFDPDQTGVGTQPTGFDQLSALYGRYRVWSCKYEFKLFTTNIVGTRFALVPTNSDTGYAGNLQAACNLPFARFGISSMYSGTICMAQKIDLPLLNGRTHQQYIDDDTTAALVSANPSEILNLHVIMNSVDGASNSSGAFSIRLEYDVEFYDAIMLTPSFFKPIRIIDGVVLPVEKEKEERKQAEGTVTSAPTSLLGMIGL